MNTRTTTAVAVATEKQDAKQLDRMKTLLPGFTPELGDAIQLVVPSDTTWSDPTQREALMADEPSAATKRRNMLVTLQALLELDAEAKAASRPLADVAADSAKRCRVALEEGAVTLFDANRQREVAVRSAAVFFSNLQDSVVPLRRKIHAMNVAPRELATGPGLKRLDAILRNRYSRPDSRDSFGFVHVSGYPGTPEALRRLGRTVEKYRGILVTDAPDFSDHDALVAASDVGGLLEELPGAEVYHRRMILFGNLVRARRAFVGEYARESQDLFIPISGAWLGGYMDNVVQGYPWRTNTGYGRPIAGVDGVKNDLLLDTTDGHLLYLDHHINPCLPLGPGSEQCVIWGVDTMSQEKGGVQIGVAAVENMLVRYTEWLVKKEVIFDERGLEAADKKLSAMLRGFMEVNTGAGQMFRSGSSFTVTPDFEEKSLQVSFTLLYQEVAETATITVMKKSKSDPGEVSVSNE